MIRKFFTIFFFSISSVIPCQIEFQAVKSSDLLPVLPKVVVKESFSYEHKVTQRCYNASLNSSFAVVRNKVAGGGFEDQLFAESEKQIMLRIKGNTNIPYKWRFSKPELIIACASEGEWLVFLTKNGLLSTVTIKKNVQALQEGKNWDLFNAQFHAQSNVPKPLQALNLNEKNCNLYYDSSKGAFVLSYVGLPDSKIDQRSSGYKKLLYIVCFGFVLLLAAKRVIKTFQSICLSF